MKEEDAYVLGYCVVKFDDKEIWAFKRKPELFPYDKNWFLYLSKEKRAENGVKIEIGGNYERKL
jgi:hypothetical protein